MSSNLPNGSGAVVSLWRYPVKSMLGEELTTAAVTDGGLLGDRAYGLIDQATGNVASAKLPRKWGKLLGCRSAFVEPPVLGKPLPPVQITLSDGTIVTSEHEQIDVFLSQMLQRDVTLATQRPKEPSVERLDALAAEETILDIGALMMEGRFSDYAAVHLMTTATLDRLNELYPQGRFEVRRFRPNIVVTPAPDQKGFVENDWVGKTVAIGDQVRLRITDPCPRCAITTLAQSDLPEDLGVLRAIAQHNQLGIPALEGEKLPSAGVYAFVLQGGTVHQGDTVRVEPPDQ
ncbi:MOSC domain-containing protein [Leptothoe kymatousa]|uniref:MOSC domain-containing protein n=1 Tax=Leptothoe kymatousa TAU-MAC 1615 TaxID=2364775 RepID=A0ABS5Y3K4_9CYAN|nr:MOSC domain-containing protein [Leptothoe kymatousa]MBT9312423.1 MOSC domain-containing protein [Leptothoe kymatousa TAU-MAC 1615]